MTGIFLNYSADQAVSLSTLIVSIGAVIQSLEFLTTSRHAVLGGFNRWSAMRSMYCLTVKMPLRRATDVLFSNPSFLALNLIIVLCSILILTLRSPGASKWFLLVLIVCRLILCSRNRIDLSAADQMQLMVSVGCAVYWFAGNEVLRTAAIWFVSLETILIYVFAGVVKAAAPLWRSGDAVSKLMRTQAWGDRSVYEMICAYPWLIGFASWSTIVFECVLPFLAFAGPIPCLIFICFGFLFHALNTFVMGLNDFLWAFSASYPLLLWFSIDFQQKFFLLF